VAVFKYTWYTSNMPTSVFLRGLFSRPKISFFLLLAFFLNSIGPRPQAKADEFRLPAPGVRVSLSPEYNPAILKGIKVHPDNPFRFDFILDQGDSKNSSVPQATKLIKYFLASLTIPENDLWVNLSPYEKDRIIPQSFGLTEMGRDLLAEDYMLKQITASLMYPQDAVGKKFWKRIYEEAEKKFGTTDIPVNTFNKVWIVPEKAVVYENVKAGTAYVVESKLKVMLEQDYLALEKNQSPTRERQPGDMFNQEQQRTCPQADCQANKRLNVKAPQGNHLNDSEETSALGSQLIREIVIPDLNHEVNTGKNFAQLRQVYNSLILAAWYKKKIKDSILAQIYDDKNKIQGLVIPANAVETIYQRYLQAFKKGVYNYIKEEPDLITNQTIPRKYFSGGIEVTHLSDMAMVIVHDIDDKELSNGSFQVTADLAMSNEAMLSHPTINQQTQSFYKKFFPGKEKPMSLTHFAYDLAVHESIKERSRGIVLYLGSGVDLTHVLVTTNGAEFDMVDQYVSSYEDFINYDWDDNTYREGVYLNEKRNAGFTSYGVIKDGFISCLVAELKSLGISKDNLQVSIINGGFKIVFEKKFPGETEAHKYTFNFINEDTTKFNPQKQYDILFQKAGRAKSKYALSPNAINRLSPFMRQGAFIVINPYDYNVMGGSENFRHEDMSFFSKEQGSHYQPVTLTPLALQLEDDLSRLYNRYGYGFLLKVFRKIRADGPIILPTPAGYQSVGTADAAMLLREIRPGRKKRDSAQLAKLAHTAVLFAPGGYQSAGIGKELYDHYPQVREIYAEANDVARRVLGDDKFDVTEFSFNTQQEELVKRTVGPILAIVAYQIALWEIYKKEILKSHFPKMILGISIGMVPAFYASGALDLEHTLELTIKYAQYLEAVTRLAANRRFAIVIIAHEKLEQILSNHPQAVVAIRISDSRCTISAPLEEFPALQEQITGMKGRIIPVKLPVVSHDPHLAMAAVANESFKAYLGTLPFKSPYIPLFSNVHPGKTLSSAEAIRDDFWQSQINLLPLDKIIRGFQSSQGINYIDLLGAYDFLSKNLGQETRGSLSVDSMTDFPDMQKKIQKENDSAQLARRATSDRAMDSFRGPRAQWNNSYMLPSVLERNSIAMQSISQALIKAKKDLKKPLVIKYDDFIALISMMKKNRIFYKINLRPEILRWAESLKWNNSFPMLIRDTGKGELGRVNLLISGERYTYSDSNIFELFAAALQNPKDIQKAEELYTAFRSAVFPAGQRDRAMTTKEDAKMKLDQVIDGSAFLINRVGGAEENYVSYLFNGGALILNVINFLEYKGSLKLQSRITKISFEVGEWYIYLNVRGNCMNLFADYSSSNGFSKEAVSILKSLREEWSDSAMLVKGGIDLTPGKMNLQTKMAPPQAGDNGGVKFHLDPAMLQQLQNASGFVPVIINVQPLTDLRGFLMNR